MWEELQEELFPKISGDIIKTCTNVKQLEPVCPECGRELAFEGGCNTCKNCGWSKCDQEDLKYDWK